MTFLRKIIFRILIVGIILLAILVLARNSIGIWLAKDFSQKTFPFSSSIAFLDVQLMKPRVVAREIAFLNPPELFHEPIAAKINRMEMDYVPTALFRSNPHVRRLLFEMDNVTIVQNSKRQLNWILLKQTSMNRKVQIDQLILSLNQVTYIDETKSEHKTYTYACRMEPRIYKDLKDTEDLRRILYQFVVDSLPAKKEMFVKQKGGAPSPELPGVGDVWDGMKDLLPPFPSDFLKDLKISN